MPIDNHPIEQEELMAYLDGELPAHRATAAAAHLEQCRECQALAASVQAVSLRLSTWQVEPHAPQLTQHVAAALDDRATKPRRIFGRWAWGLAGAGAVVATASLVVLLDMSLAPQKKLQLRAIASFMIAPPNPKIVHAAQLVLSTNEFDKARAALEEIRKRHQGYFGELNVRTPAGAGRTLEATLRIPADQREAAMAEIRKLGRVESESQTGEDVTQRYVDLEARLSNARNTEQRLTDLLRQRTGKLSDVLSVEQEIDRVRGEIESMEAQKKSMANRVDFATLNVKIAEDYKAQLQLEPDSTLARFRNAAIQGYRSVLDGAISVIVFLLSAGPSLLILAGLLFFPARFLWKRLRRNPVSNV